MTKTEALLSQMTLEEKVAQLLQITSNDREVEQYKSMGTIGSFLHVLGSETEGYIAPTREARLPVQPIFGIDAIHGHSLLKEATIYPSQLAMACSFNEDLIEQMGYATAKEVCADGLDWMFSPVLCLGRDLRWGRVDETFGEDAYLASRLGYAIVKGYQTDNLVAACAKHYLGYGEATGGRDSYDTEITERKAREIFLQPFKAAVDAGCMTVMTAYGSIDGTPLTQSHRYLTEILKEEYGFDGFVVTDWDNFQQVYSGQRTSESMADACAEGLLAGNDMCMVSKAFYEATIDAVKKGIVSEAVVDDAVRRVLSVKERLGLLGGEKVRPDKSVIGCKAHQKLNYELTVESVVLLKNDGVLPLTGVKKLAVIGPNADDMRAQYGDWTFFTHPDYKPDAVAKEGSYTLLQGLKEVYGEEGILYAKGCSVEGNEDKATSDKMIKEALKVAKKADAIVLAIGDNRNWNGEWQDVAQPILRGRQIELVKKLASLNKKLVAVLVNGKPLVLTEIAPYCNGIVESFNQGDQGGLALARLMKGEENFSGKLPISFPRAVGTHPDYYNQYDYWHGSKYKDMPKGENEYPFGFGLSYSDTKITNAALSKMEAGRGETLTLAVEVENESERGCKEVVQVYYRDRVCKVLTPVRQLCDFKKIALASKEKKRVEFTIDPQKLGYYNAACEYVVDEGDFDLYISLNGKDFLTCSFLLKD